MSEQIDKPKKDALFFPVVDNGMGLSRTRWAVSMFCLALSRALAGRRIVVQSIGMPDPAGAMNLATQEFMESGCDRMLVIDTDETFQPSDVEMLLSHDLDFVSGLYPKKTIDLEWPVLPLNDETPQTLFANDAPSPVEVQCVPRGFLNVHRRVFELLTPHVKSFVDENGRTVHMYWRTIPGAMSEDYALCNLYREHGGKVWIDHRIRVRHEGTAVFPIGGKF